MRESAIASDVRMRKISEEIQVEAFRQGRTVSDLAEKIGCCRQTLARKLRQPETLTLGDLCGIARILNHTPDFFMGAERKDG